MGRSMFERYGGFAKISRVVMSFYNKMVSSPITSHYFAKTNMKRLIDHQTKFIASMMGGPASYTNEHLKRVHAHLGITDEAFDESVYLLTETMEDFDFENEDMQQVQDEMESRKYVIVSRSEQ
jgi:hemoglobin